MTARASTPYNVMAPSLICYYSVYAIKEDYSEYVPRTTKPLEPRGFSPDDGPFSFRLAYLDHRHIHFFPLAYIYYFESATTE